MARTPPFTAQQAKELADAVREFPEGTEQRWSRVAERVSGDKGARACKLHWDDVLEPRTIGLKVGDWSPVEEVTLHAAVEELGTSDWAAITKRFPGRAKNGVKNRFYELKRKSRTSAKKAEQSSEGGRGAAASAQAREPRPWCVALQIIPLLPCHCSKEVGGGEKRAVLLV